MYDTAIKECKDCNGYQGVYSPLTCTQPKIAGDYSDWWGCWNPIGTALIWNEEITEIAHGIVCISPSTTTGGGLQDSQLMSQTVEK